MGEVPGWYPLIVAARYLKVAPWELRKQSVFWVHAALMARTSEIKAQEHRQRHAESRNRAIGS